MNLRTLTLHDLIIAEIAQAHDGSLGTAHAYIDAVAETGADAIKFQVHIADAESTPGEPWRIKFSRQDATRYDYWKRMEFTPEQWRGLADHARDAGLAFLATPFSMQAIDLLEQLDVPAWKVGSGDISTLPMIERMAATGKPVLLSSGMSTWDELDTAVERVRSAGAEVAVFQCTTSYPCPPETVGLNVIDELRDRYRCPAGLSDHSGTIFPGLAAAARGANMLEIHTVFDRRCFGPDTPASVTIDELSELVRGWRMIKQMLASPVEKETLASSMGELRTMFGRSIVAATELPSGHTLREDDLAYKKPADGIPAAHWRDLLGRTLSRAVPKNHLFQEDDLV